MNISGCMVGTRQLAKLATCPKPRILQSAIGFCSPVFCKWLLGKRHASSVKQSPDCLFRMANPMVAQDLCNRGATTTEQTTPKSSAENRQT